jgi:23S rRNA-intervening sequence protein
MCAARGVRFRVSGVRMTFREAMMKSYMDVEDLEVYQKLCRLHIEICDLSHAWPSEERYEIGSQIADLPTAPQHNSRRKTTTVMSVIRLRE